jgi:hypothetical protein
MRNFGAMKDVEFMAAGDKILQPREAGEGVPDMEWMAVPALRNRRDSRISGAGDVFFDEVRML